MGSFTKEAPCRDADPWLFDQSQIPLAQPALNYCKECFFWEKCESLVEPRSSYFDGVCGGKVWKNGRMLAKLVPNFPNKLLVAKDDYENTEAISGSELRGN